MSAQNGDTVMQEDALDQEEELPFGEEKLVIVRIFSQLVLRRYSICNGHKSGNFCNGFFC
jgi:hypothetical protein